MGGGRDHRFDRIGGEMMDRRNFLKLLFSTAAAATAMPTAVHHAKLGAPAKRLSNLWQCWAYGEEFDFSKESSTFIHIPKGDFVLRSIGLAFDPSCPVKQVDTALHSAFLRISLNGIPFSDDGLPLWNLGGPALFMPAPFVIYPRIGMNAGSEISTDLIGDPNADVSKVKGMLMFYGERRVV